MQQVCGGGLVLFVILLTWVSSPIMTAAPLVLWYQFGWVWPALVLALYVASRAVLPLGPWPAFHRRLRRLNSQMPYFRSQRTVFQTEDAIPAPDSKMMYAVYPHGCLCLGPTVNLCLSPFTERCQFKLLVAPALFWLPGVSELFSWIFATSASKSNTLSLMKQGKNIAILPGGFQDLALYQKDEFHVYVSQRKGFIKYCLQYGYNVSPVFTFGEERTYSALRSFLPFRLRLSSYNVPSALFASKLGFMPDPDVDMVTVIGDALPLPKIANPTAAEVDEHHARFVSALVALFDRYKGQYAADPNAVLYCH